jgi:hypothetical protein
VFGNAPRIHVLVKITKENNIGIGMFLYNQLGNQLLKENHASRTQIATTLKLPFVLFPYSGPGKICGL